MRSGTNPSGKYEYRGFEIEYTVEEDPQDKKSFLAKAIARCNKDNQEFSEAFQTTYSSKKGAESEIKTMVQGYIDDEWNTFNQTH